VVRVWNSCRAAAGWLTLFCGLAALVSGAERANAALMLELSDGVTTVTLFDGSPLDANPTAGRVSYYGSVGGFLVNLSTGISKPVIGGPDVAALDLSSFNVSGAATSLLTIRLTDTDFMQEPVSGAISAVGGNTGGAVSISTYADFDNTPFGTGVLLADFGTFLNNTSMAGIAFSASQISPIPDGVDISPPFSLTIIAQIMHGASWHNSSFDVAVTTFNVQNDTEAVSPGGLSAVAAGLVLFGLSRRRRQGGAVHAPSAILAAKGRPGLRNFPG